MPDLSTSHPKLPLAENQKEALRYLANQARTAHYEGDGVCVNHICAIALTKVWEWLNKQNCHISIHDIYWALTMALYWLIDDYMFRLVSRVIEKLESNNEKEESLCIVIRQAFYLIEQCLNDPEPAIKELMNCDLVWLQGHPVCDEYVCENLVLLTFAVELIWWRNPEGKTWLALINKWAKKTPSVVKKSLNILKSRLKAQTKAIFPQAPFSIDIHILDKFEPDIKRLYQAWESFFDCEWQEIDKILKDLVGAISYESPLALPIFHFHHLTRVYRNGLGSQEEPGLTRSKLQTCSHKGTLFDEIRFSSFYKKIMDLWGGEKLVQGAHIRFHCFRLAMLNQISVLRCWELALWMEGVRQQYEAVRELLRFNDESYIPDIASDVIRLAVFSINFKDTDPTLIDAVRKIDRAPKEIRKKLILTLLSMRRFLWPRVLKAFSLISDAIPEELLPAIADWCNHYLNSPLPVFGIDPSSVLSIWKDIFSHIHYSNDIFKKLHPIVIKIAANLPHWRSDPIGIVEYIINAPLELVLEVRSVMFEKEIIDGKHNTYRWKIIFNAVKKRPELENYFNEKLISTAKTPVQKQHLPYLNPYEGKFQAVDNQEFRLWCRNQILSLSQDIINRQKKGKRFIQIMYSNMMELVSWPQEEQELIGALLNAIKAPHVMAHEVPEILMCLYELVDKGPQSHADMIQNDFFLWLNKPPKGEEFWPKTGGPLSTTQIYYNHNLETFWAICHLAIAICIRKKDQIARKVAKWLVKNILSAPIEANALMFYLVALLGISTNILNKAELGSCIQILFLRSNHFVQIKTDNYYILKNLLDQIIMDWIFRTSS